MNATTITDWEEKSEVQDVLFLTPAKVKLRVGDQEKEVIVSVDIANRKVYDGSGPSQLTERVFEFLDKINILPENFFAASKEISQKAAEMKSEHEKFDMTAMLRQVNKQ